MNDVSMIKAEDYPFVSEIWSATHTSLLRNIRIERPTKVSTILLVRT